MPPRRKAAVSSTSANAQVARLIRAARNKAGLTQKQLADALSTTQSTIARLEDPEYTGHSVSTLERIANVLKVRLDVRFIRN